MKAFESYHLTNTHTELTEITYHTASRVVNNICIVSSSEQNEMMWNKY